MNTSRPATYSRRAPLWRLLGPVVFVAAGVLFVTSAVSSGGTDLRAGRYQDLAGFVEDQKAQVEHARAHEARLAAEVTRLSGTLGSKAARRARAKAESLRGAAGMTPVEGPGLTITLNDAPEDVQASAANVEDTIVHQQDIQAVANALWAGGAVAMTIQGQRVISTTGIKCVGNTVVLHDVPYAPPYVISAVGPVSGMAQAVDRSAYVRLYLQAVDAYGLGWHVQPEPALRLSGYRGSTEMAYAQAVPLAPARDG